MEIVKVDALAGLKAALEAPESKRWDVYQERVLEPLKSLWEPALAWAPAEDDEQLSAEQKAVRALKLYSPDLDAEEGLRLISLLEEAGSWPEVYYAVEESIRILDPYADDVKLPPVLTTLVLASDPMPRLKGYTGFGGRPGQVLVQVWPTDYNIPRLPAAAAHALHHNIRLTVEPWAFDTTVGQYIVMEGLAEAFAAELYGEESLGPWSDALDDGEMAEVKPRYAEAMNISGFNKIRGYIFGDWAAEEYGYEAVGLPDFAGYTIGYRLVRAYIERTGLNAAEATYKPWQEIVEGSGFFA